jgi:hypothetical protein
MESLGTADERPAEDLVGRGSPDGLVRAVNPWRGGHKGPRPFGEAHRGLGEVGAGGAKLETYRVALT